MDWHLPTSHIRTRVDCPNLRRRAYLHYRRRHPKAKTTRIRLKNGASQLRFFYYLYRIFKKIMLPLQTVVFFHKKSL